MAKYKIIVCRINIQDGSFMMSRPCASCTQLMTAVGIRRVQYSVQTESTETVKDTSIFQNKQTRCLMETSLDPVVLSVCRFVEEDTKSMDPFRHVSHGFRYIQNKRAKI